MEDTKRTDKRYLKGKINSNALNTPYDDVFRTLLNDCSDLVIPLINEVFEEHYTGGEKIIFSQNEHFLNRQDGDESERITDTSFRIVDPADPEGKETKKYHLECQSVSDSSMLIRFYEYGTQIALDDGELKDNVLTVTLPYAALLLLRHSAETPDCLKIRMVTPGGDLEYDIRVIKSQKYTVSEIFEKGLLLLIPFYIFTHEKQFGRYEREPETLQILQAEYAEIRERLEEQAARGSINEYTKCTILDMSKRVLEKIASKYDSVREGVKTVMGGKILEYEAKDILNKGIAQGEARGETRGLELKIIQQVQKKLRKNKSIAEIAEELEETQENVERISRAISQCGSEDPAEVFLLLEGSR